MVAILILSLALFSGASSAFRLEDVAIASNGSTNGTTNVTTLHQFPSIVQVEFYNSWGWGAWEQTCAASILNELNVLTAASCFSGPSYPNVQYRRIRAGANTRNAGGMVIYVDRATNFPRTSDGVVHDISVVRLRSRMFFGTLSQQARILQQGSVVPRDSVFNQVGWGHRNVTNIALSSAFVTSFSVATNQTSNTTSNLITAYPSFEARFNGDVGGPWIWGTITVGVIPANNRLMNSTAFSATTVSAYTNWIVNEVTLWR
ncbi:chymotrypsin-like elastase family member 2A [Pararge aegeria]|uniref:chymotrypsin-like elastase family member 2A n=1 Tax=Pararge aegeria TaxID=116150 RepID=UPI0019CFC6B5|nr:chymotrypsin-like elastase family member 2A [Pararge aegeria]